MPDFQYWCDCAVVRVAVIVLVVGMAMSIAHYANTHTAHITAIQGEAYADTP